MGTGELLLHLIVKGGVMRRSSVIGVSLCVTPVSVCDMRTQAWNWSLMGVRSEYVSLSLMLQGQTGISSLPTGSLKSLRNSFRSTWFPAPEGWAWHVMALLFSQE